MVLNHGLCDISPWLAENPLPPLDPMSEDDNEPNHGPRTSEADAYSACGSLDGFIQPPPPHVAAAYHAIGPEDFQRMYPTNCTAERMPSEEPMPASPMPAATPCQATQVADNPLIESMLALAQLSQADLQLGRQLFNVSLSHSFDLMSNADTFISGASFTGPRRNSMEAVGYHVVEPTPHPINRPQCCSHKWSSPVCVQSGDQGRSTGFLAVSQLKTFPSHLMCVLLQLGPSSTEDTRNSLQKLIRVVQSPPIVTRGTAHPFAASADQNVYCPIM
ncbi:hypothetical protein H4Q26_011964 [Puccinia striiformis f. sp. tritici PST-130]|nr:hypothetical protein H4Q26_011964 [Puccinia striiformis f. sp. tritici PST-130]